MVANLVACGSAYYVSVLAKYTLEKACRIPTEAVMASEFRYSDPVIDENNLVIVISQSGETADSLAALREAKRRGADVMCVTVEGMEEKALAVADNCIAVPQVHPVLQPSLSLIPLQVFAYYVALNRGCDVDKPRNLAKSVTVE